MTGDIMEFPETFEEFARRYRIVDSERVYTNGAELIPTFRVEQWLENMEHRRKSVDRDALLELADELDRVGYNDWLHSGEWEPEEIARSIRKALGAVE